MKILLAALLLWSGGALAQAGIGQGTAQGAAVTCGQMPALTGDTTTSAGNCATTTTKTGGVAFGTAATTSAGGLPAVATNTPAAAGALGERVQLTATNSSASVTFTSATPTVATTGSDLLTANCVQATSSGTKCIFPIYFTGASLPTGVSANTPYYIDPASISGGVNFQFATSVANAVAGTDVGTTSTGSGTAVMASYLATSGTIQPTLAIVLPAGEWMCQGRVGFIEQASNVPTAIQAGISATTTIGVTNPSQSLLNVTLATGADTNMLQTGISVLSVASAIPIYMNGMETWTGGNNPVAASAMNCWRFQ